MMDEQKELAYQRLVAIWKRRALDSMNGEIGALENEKARSLELIELREQARRREVEHGQQLWRVSGKSWTGPEESTEANLIEHFQAKTEEEVDFVHWALEDVAGIIRYMILNGSWPDPDKVVPTLVAWLDEKYASAFETHREEFACIKKHDDYVHPEAALGASYSAMHGAYVAWRGDDFDGVRHWLERGLEVVGSSIQGMYPGKTLEEIMEELKSQELDPEVVLAELAKANRPAPSAENPANGALTEEELRALGVLDDTESG